MDFLKKNNNNKKKVLVSTSLIVRETEKKIKIAKSILA